MRIFLFLLIAMFCSAEPDLDGLSRRLASDDPAEREAAREEAGRLGEESVPSLEARAAGEKDPEVATALRAAAEAIRARALDPHVERLVADLSRSTSHAWRRLVRLDGRAVEVLHQVAVRHEALLATDPWPGARNEKPPTHVRRARELLACLSPDALGTEAAAWSPFVAENRGRPLLGLARAAAVGRGYRVQDRQASRAVTDLIRHREDASGKAAIAVSSWLIEETIEATLMTGDQGDVVVALREWSLVCKGGVEWHEGRVRLATTYEQLVEFLKDPSPDLRRGALRALAPWKHQAFRDARPLLVDQADLFLPLLPEEGADLTAAELRALLSIRRTQVTPERLASPQVLEAISLTGDHPGIRLEGLAALDRMGDLRVARVADEVLSDLTGRGPEWDSLRGFAGYVLARQGDEAQARRCVALLGLRYVGGWRREIAIALASRGFSEGAVSLRRAAVDEVLSEGDRRTLRQLFVDAPASDKVEEWEAWGQAGTGQAWNAETRRWSTR